ncbi:MAG: ABC transporter ATP-binding protein [Candidatus Sabulitectum sp.]|nr:ABC transporter ATP-binding protein [Candidatus Sabulitectum sp.]
MNDVVIEAINLHKSFGSKKSVDGISFEVIKGEVFGYLGHNGSGKTTTIRLILGLLKPDSGTVSLLGQNPYPDSSYTQQLHRRIGVLLEKDAVYHNMTGWENLIYWAQLYGLSGADAARCVNETIDIVRIRENSQSLTRTYSKGMRRQLAIARALLCQPEVLFLDEPTSGLDPIARVRVRTIMENLVSSGKCTVFLSSHDLEEVEKLCKRVLIIENGRKVISGTVAELRKPHSKLAIQLKPSNGCYLAESLYHKVEMLPYVRSLELRSDFLFLKLDEPDMITNIINLLVSSGASIIDIKRNMRSLEDAYNDILSSHGSDLK